MLYSLLLPMLKVTAAGHNRYHALLVKMKRRPALLLKNRVVAESHYAPTCRRLRRLDLQLLRWIAPAKAAAYALGLFEYPHRMPCKQNDAQWLATLRREELRYAGKNIVIYRAGEARAAQRVLVVHGWEARAVMLRPLITALADAGYEVIAPDLLGHGESEGEQCAFSDLVALIRLAGERYGAFAAALGHSFGGTALLHAATLGFHSDRLITLSSPESLPRVLDAYIDFHQVPASLKPAINQLYLTRHGQNPEHIAWTHWPSLSVPTLICHDRDDHNIELAQAYHLASVAPGAELYLSQGSGHRGIVRDKGVIAHIIAFIQRAASR